MKLRKNSATLILALFALVLWSCTDPSTEVMPENPSEADLKIDNLLGSRSISSKIRSVGFGSPIGAFYEGSSSARTSGSPIESFRSKTGRSSLLGARVSEYCFTETYQDDGAGNYTYTLDFGDGCEFYGEFLKGKMVEEGQISENSFSAVTTFTDFGGEDWLINGTTAWDGTWSEGATDTGEEEFEGTYTYESDLVEQFMEFYYDDKEDSVETSGEYITLNYIANGSESFDELGFTIDAHTENVSVSTGETFTSEVGTPLYYSFECEKDDVWIFVSGVESGSYSYEGESGNYSIDYGDGTCDNIITITENGVTETIDIEEVWEDWEEECGDDHEDEWNKEDEWDEEEDDEKDDI